eukprot:4558491-Pyramimonas_sp.AAC.1
MELALVVGTWTHPPRDPAWKAGFEFEVSASRSSFKGSPSRCFTTKPPIVEDCLVPDKTLPTKPTA